MQVDITGLPKYAVVAALWNAAKRQSRLDAKPCMSETRAREVADWLMESKLPDDRLDWLDSRAMKVDIRGDSFDATLYDRDNGGEGAAARVISTLRQYTGVHEHAKEQKVDERAPGTAGSHDPGAAASAEEVLPGGFERPGTREPTGQEP